MEQRDGALLDALDRLAGRGYEFEGYLSNHGPMASEALVELGAIDVVAGWADLYKVRLDVEPEAQRPIDSTGDQWRTALGDISRVTDWTNFFDRADPYYILAAEAALHGIAPLR